MCKRNFEEWFKTFRASINEYDYYTDFEKVRRNAAKLEIEINILNCLIGAENIEEKFISIIKKYPECLKAIPILLAVREREIYCQDENGAINYRFDKANQTPEQYAYFMRETGLFYMLQNHIIRCLNDYVTGVEVGMDSNARKNRGGHQMERLVEKYLKHASAKYSKEITTKELREKINLPDDFAPNKRWDFAIETERNIYALETNFYVSSGSKLNETARSYRQISEQAKNINGFVFVWITDGKGWESAKTNLEETFNALQNLYNISDMEAGIFNKIFQ